MNLKLILFLIGSVALNLSAGSTGSKPTEATMAALIAARKNITTAEMAIAAAAKRNMVTPEQRIALGLRLKEFVAVWANLPVAQRSSVAYSEAAGMVNKMSKLLPRKQAKPIRKDAARVYAESRRSVTQA